MVLGVADRVKGKQAFTGVLETPDHIRQRVYELTRPHLTVDVFPSRTAPNCLLMSVPQSADIHSDTKGRSTHRINKDCVPLLPADHRRIREEKQGIDWSAEPTDLKISDIDSSAMLEARQLLSRFQDDRRRLVDATNEDILRSLGVVHANGRLTRAGEVLFCRTELIAEAIVYQYRLTPGGEPRAVQRLAAPLVAAFSRVMELVEARQTTTPINLPNGQQITIADFPQLAVREAISNALCHRDYNLTSPSYIEHSPEVFSVTSPGPLVAGVTTDNIITTSSRPRNPLLTRAARHLGMAEELGRGVDRMYRELIRAGRPVPTITALHDTVRVTFVGGAPDTQIAKFISGLPEHEQDDTDTMLVIYALCTNKIITSAQISNALQKPIMESEAVLRRLSTDNIGLLEPTRSTFRRSMPTYRLRSAALRELGNAVTYQRRTTDELDRKIISHIKEYGRINNRTIQNILDVNMIRARDIISDMATRGLIVRISEQSRGSKVEWGPGPALPPEPNRRNRRSSNDLNEQTELFHAHDMKPTGVRRGARKVARNGQKPS